MSEREKIIEVMARGLCIADDRDPDDGSCVLHALHKDRPAWKDFERSATAALAALEAAGVRLVPVEATYEMMLHGSREQLRGDDPASDDGYPSDIYRAMISASPYAKDKTNDRP